MRLIWMVLLIGVLFACNRKESVSETTTNPKERIAATNVDSTSPYVVVLGNVQDAGYPQIGCMKACCKEHWHPEAQKKMITCLGLVEQQSRKSWLFEATPDFKYQTKGLSNLMQEGFRLPNGIFLTHAHIGHYVGLMHLGREAMNASRVPVYAMPRMKQYLETSGPWSLLVKLENIDLQPMTADSSILLENGLTVTPHLVPHRGEYSETVGFTISGPKKQLLFIPDIDKWHLWKRDIKQEISKVDYAFLDATFFKNGEVGHRDMSEIPHPFVEESMQLFEDLSADEKAKIHFIHFNHTNPLLRQNSAARKEVLKKGFKLAEEGMRIYL